MRKKRLLLMATTLVLAMGFIGCGKQESEEKKSDTKVEMEGLSGEELFEQGEAYFEEGNVKKAEEYYLESLEKEYGEAAYMLGYMNEYAIGRVKSNYEKAVEYYEKGIELGSGNAANNLGFMYDMGYGVEQDYEKAMEYYQKP